MHFPLQQNHSVTSEHPLSGWIEKIAPMHRIFKASIGVGMCVSLFSGTSVYAIAIMPAYVKMITDVSLSNSTNITNASLVTSGEPEGTSLSASDGNPKYALYIPNEISDGVFVNNGSVVLDLVATDDLEVVGISARDEGVTICNRKDVELKVTSVQRGAKVIALDGYNVRNDGELTVTALGGSADELDVRVDAFGIAYSDSVTNNGDIVVKAVGGAGKDARANAIGINATAGGVTNERYVTNEGDITVTAIGGEGTETADADAIGIFSPGNVVNKGEITVTAVGGGDSSGIALGLAMTGGNTLHSSNLIHVFASGSDPFVESYQILGLGGSDEPVIVTGFAMEFGTQQQVNDVYEGSIGGDVEFRNDAKLYVYTNDQLKSGKNDFVIPPLLANDVRDRVTQGYFSSREVMITSPDYIVSELSPREFVEEESMRALDEPTTSLQTISIEYAPQASASLMAVGAVSQMTDKGTAVVNKSLISSMVSYMQKSNPTLAQYEGVQLASTAQITDTSAMVLGVPVEKKSSVFVLPYYTSSSDSSDPMGYDADIYGLTGGYNYHYNPNLIFGFHAGYGNADVDFDGAGYNDRNEDIDAGTAGVQGIYRFNQNWLLSGTSTFFYTSNDYTDNAPTNRETGDYNTYGLKTNIDLGYVFMTAHGRIIPEVGLTHLWQHNDEFTTTNLDNANTTYGDMDENEVYARLAVSWLGEFESGDWKILPNVKVGVEQTLTDGELSNSMTAGTAVRTVTYGMDDTTFTVDAGLDFNQGRYSFGLGYNGAYSSDVADNSVYLQMKYYF